jgi:hypothetical protein
MPSFFAHFKTVDKVWIRHQTRIYLGDFLGSRPAGVCVGAIVGKNPGAARSSASGWGPLELAGDKMLPNVRNIFLKAYACAGKSPPLDAYVQVLNLFYICGQDLKLALSSLAQQANPHPDPAESLSYPFIWYAWGGELKPLNPLKDRFLIDHQKALSFFYSLKEKRVITRQPDPSELAKHPQGLPHEPMVNYLAKLI